jgi:hypothetical protein
MMIPLVSGSGRRLSCDLVKAQFKARYCSRIVANPTGRVEFDSKGLTACTSVHLPPKSPDWKQTTERRTAEHILRTSTFSSDAVVIMVALCEQQRSCGSL